MREFLLELGGAAHRVASEAQIEKQRGFLEAVRGRGRLFGAERNGGEAAQVRFQGRALGVKQRRIETRRRPPSRGAGRRSGPAASDLAEQLEARLGRALAD